MKLLKLFRPDRLSFKDVRNFLSGIPCINQGGCDIAAYAMYLWLKKHKKLNKKFKFVLGYRSYCEDAYINNQNVLRSKNGIAEAPNHMFIYYDDKYMDCDEYVDEKSYRFIQYVDEEWFIKNCVSNINSWNFEFDRKKYIPIIEKKLGIKLS